jgi:hypothetical protein
VAVDQQLIQAIHRIENELDTETRGLKALRDKRIDLITDLDEFKTLQDALQAVKEARVRLKLAIQDNHELNRLEVEIGETKFHKHDLAEILSHHLVAYHEETGRDVVRDNESRTRQIELKAKMGKPALDQPRLPLGINRHLGERQPISDTKPEVRRIEVGDAQ